jgi:transposase-like protein
MEKKPFDFEAFKKDAAERLKKGETLLGRDGVFTPLLKEFLEEAMDGELEAHIEADEAPNRKNGKGKKQVKTPVGKVEIQPPRDRNSTFEPEILPKDAIHYKVRHEGRVVNRAVYCIIGVNQEGFKELLGMHIGESEGSRFWPQVLKLNLVGRN